jgi:hypothetical protein
MSFLLSDMLYWVLPKRETSTGGEPYAGERVFRVYGAQGLSTDSRSVRWRRGKEVRRRCDYPIGQVRLLGLGGKHSKQNMQQTAPLSLARHRPGEARECHAESTQTPRHRLLSTRRTRRRRLIGRCRAARRNARRGARRASRARWRPARACRASAPSPRSAPPAACASSRAPAA